MKPNNHSLNRESNNLLKTICSPVLKGHAELDFYLHARDYAEKYLNKQLK